MYLKNPEYFLQIVKEGSISRAAENLYLSQPYMSQYLHKLEQTVGAVLLDRTHTPLKLTPAGEIFYSYLERQDYLDRQLASDLRDLENQKQPELHIGVSTWRGSTLLPDILPQFVKEFPYVQIDLHEAPVPDLPALAESNTTDFCIMHVPDDPALTYEMVMDERILLVCHREHPALRGLNVALDGSAPFPDLRILEKERLIMLPDNWRLSGLLRNEFAVHNMDPKNVLVTTSNTTAINLAAEGMGFAFLQESGVARTPYLERLAFFSVGQPPLTCSTAVVYRKGRFLSPAARAFIDLTREYYARYDYSRRKGT